MLKDREKVGRALLRKIGSPKRIITAEWKSAFGIRIMKLFPYFMGNMFSKVNLKNQTIQIK